MKELVKAVNKVMAVCENIEKGATVGRGNNAYKGVKDKDVKLALNKAMRDNGLAIFQTGVEPTIHIERWEEETNYGIKQKQQVMTDLIATYTLTHVSGDSIELKGYGHGIDTQDKSAGKATTYALKNVLLYTFMVATGDIDDADSTHSDDHAIPQKKKAAPRKTPAKKTKDVTLEVDGDDWDKVLGYIGDNKEMGFDKLVANLQKRYNVSSDVKKALSVHFKSLK